MSIPFRSVVKNLDEQFDTNDIDEFRDIVDASLKQKELSIKKDSDSLKQLEDGDEGHADIYASYIEDRWMLHEDVKNLAGQLLVVALYRQSELHIKRVVKKTHQNVDTSKHFDFNTLKSTVHFDIEILPKFATYNELRLLNNAVKHQGVVSKELSMRFPSWKLGEELNGLNPVYERMKPGVAEFIQNFVARCYLSKKTQP